MPHRTLVLLLLVATILALAATVMRSEARRPAFGLTGFGRVLASDFAKNYVAPASMSRVPRFDRTETT